MEKYRVTLTTEERDTLEKLVSVGRSAARKLTHARVLLLADTAHRREHADDQIVLALGTGLRSVERIRKRFVTEGLDTAINPKPQPPRPDKIKIKGDIEQQLVRVACSDPPEGRCHWTLQLLADELVVLGLVEAISTETRAASVKKNDIHPWIVETWCIPPHADADFVWRMEDVIQTYQLPYDARYPVVCFDEACKQLFGEVRPSQRPRPGKASAGGL